MMMVTRLAVCFSFLSLLDCLGFFFLDFFQIFITSSLFRQLIVKIEMSGIHVLMCVKTKAMLA